MASIDVTPVDPGTYEVTVIEEWSTSTHQVSIRPEDLEQLARGAPEEDFVAASFRFLLDREPKESIMSEFDLSVIGRYFPEYPERIVDYL